MKSTGIEVTSSWSAADKDNLLWLLYMSGNHMNKSLPLRDDVDGFDLTANFQIRLSLVLHVGFWQSVIIAIEQGMEYRLLGLAVVLFFATRHLTKECANLLRNKHRLTVLRFLALRMESSSGIVDTQDAGDSGEVNNA